MVTRHLTSKEFELLIDGKKDQLSADCLAHADSCGQCRQEYTELSALFHWPTSTRQTISAHSLTEQVLSQLSRQKRAIWIKRTMLVLGLLLAVVTVVAIMSVLWQYLPQDIRTTAVGLFPVMEWVGSFANAFSTIGWFSLSTYSLLIGGLLVLLVIMLADSMVISRLIRRMQKQQSVIHSQEQTAQGNRT